MAKQVKEPRKEKKCLHKNWHVKSRITLTGGIAAQERMCDDCKLIIIV